MFIQLIDSLLLGMVMDKKSFLDLCAILGEVNCGGRHTVNNSRGEDLIKRTYRTRQRDHFELFHNAVAPLHKYW
jgi:hypothetical protein